MWWIRHAPVTANNGCIYGQTDMPCDTDDAVAFEGLARQLPDDAILVTTNLQRTTQTAAAIAAAGLGMPEPVIEPELREQHFGDWQGMRYDEFWSDRDPDQNRFWLAPAHERPPGGESFADLITRVAPAIDRVVDTHAGRDIVAVAHGGTIRAAAALALGLEPENALRFAVDNLSITRIDHVRSPTLDSWRVVCVNRDPR